MIAVSVVDTLITLILTYFYYSGARATVQQGIKAVKGCMHVNSVLQINKFVHFIKIDAVFIELHYESSIVGMYTNKYFIQKSDLQTKIYLVQPTRLHGVLT